MRSFPVTPPDQDLIHDLAFLLSDLQRDVGARFVVDHLAVAIVAIHGDQDAAAGIGRPHPARLPAKSAKHHRVNHSQASTRQHGDRQLRHHRHMNGDAIAALQPAEVAQQRREFIHSHVEFAVGNGTGDSDSGSEQKSAPLCSCTWRGVDPHSCMKR